MRIVLVTLASVVLLAQVSCFHRSNPRNGHWFTGTCPGACDYYAGCKERRGERVSQETRTACTQECNEVFSSPETILAFESLVCEDAIAFVEGDSGRPPGQPPTP